MGKGAQAAAAMYTATLPVLFFIIAVVNGGKDKPIFDEDIQEIIQTVHDECVSKTGVAEDDITNCEKGIFKEDQKLKCYMFCLMEEANLLDDDDNVDYDTLVGMMPEAYQERTAKMILGCKHNDVPGKDKCQNSFDVHKCSFDTDPDLYFLL